MTCKPGSKYDGGKPRWCLVPFKEFEEVVIVLTKGAVKYDDNNWQKVPNGRNRYFSAALRHITEWWEGEIYDQETGNHHLAHAMCCLLFLMWGDNIKGRKKCKIK